MITFRRNILSPSSGLKSYTSALKIEVVCFSETQNIIILTAVKTSDLILSWYLPEWIEETVKNPSHDDQSSDTVSNTGVPYTRALTTNQRHSVTSKSLLILYIIWNGNLDVFPPHIWMQFSIGSTDQEAVSQIQTCAVSKSSQLSYD
jgi:hypothetical protein